MKNINGTTINSITKNKTIIMLNTSSVIQKGILKKIEEGWVINHNIIDPYGQIPHPIQLHPSDSENLIDGEEVEFFVGYEYYAKLK